MNNNKKNQRNKKTKNQVLTNPFAGERAKQGGHLEKNQGDPPIFSPTAFLGTWFKQENSCHEKMQ